MTYRTVTENEGSVRIRLSTKSREMYVGPFLTLEGARRLAADLAMAPDIQVVTVERKHLFRGWAPVWSRSLEPVR